MSEFLTLSQWALVVGAIIPIVVGLVTKANASAGTKATMLLALDLVGGVLTEFFASPNGFDWKGAVLHAVLTFVSSVAAYYGVLKHTVAPVVIDATARFGVGGSSEGARPASSAERDQGPRNWHPDAS